MLPASWPSWLVTAVATPLAFFALLLVLRGTGKRALAKMTAYGLTVTVAFGSAFATVLLNRSVSIVDGIVAFVMLAALQFGLAWASTRSAFVARAVTARPSALACRGAVDEAQLRRERVRIEEVWAAVRAAGLASVADALAVVLETDGSLSVVTGDGTDADALQDVQGWEPREVSRRPNAQS